MNADQIKRFDTRENLLGKYMVESPEGEWVRWGDVQKMEDEILLLRSAIRDASSDIRFAREAYGMSDCAVNKVNDGLKRLNQALDRQPSQKFIDNFNNRIHS